MNQTQWIQAGSTWTDEPLDPPGQQIASEEAWLVARSQGGDRAAFERLVHQTARLLYARLYLETADEHLAEDLVQETHLIAWRSIGQVTRPEGFRPWLFSIARSARLDAARRSGRKKRLGTRSSGATSDLLAAAPDSRRGPEESADLREQRERVLAALRSMPAEYREPLTLRYLGGADYDTITRQLNLTNGSLRGLLQRGIAKLRETLATRRGDACVTRLVVPWGRRLHRASRGPVGGTPASPISLFE